MKRSRKTGLPPGTLMHIGERKAETVRLSVIQYDAEQFSEKEFDTFEAFAQQPPRPESIVWINIHGLHDTDLLRQAGAHFNIHNLVLEDILNTDQRPKFEDHGHYLFLPMKMFFIQKEDKTVSWEQISLIFGKGFLITFQEAPGDVFDPLRERIRQGKGRIRKMQADYLAYALLDIIVDQFFAILEQISDRIDENEEAVLVNPGKEAVSAIHDVKRTLLNVRRAAWPLREMVSQFEKSESPLLEKSTRLFIRDVYDHAIQIIDNVELLREINAGLMDIYLSNIGNRTNQVMKVLTIVATLFIPLTFIVGIYGMNFEYMPELAWPWAYPAVMGLMLFLFVGMLYYFRKRKWM